MLSATKYYNTLEPHQLLLDRKQDSSILIYLLEKLQITKNGKKKNECCCRNREPPTSPLYYDNEIIYIYMKVLS